MPELSFALNTLPREKELLTTSSSLAVLSKTEKKQLQIIYNYILIPVDEYDAGYLSTTKKYLIGSRHGRSIHMFFAQPELKHNHKAIGSPKE